MSDISRSGGEAGPIEAGSWAAESLPFAVRKELLERELRRLGFGKRAGTGAQQQQQQPQAGNSHPQADGDSSHGDG